MSIQRKIPKNLHRGTTGKSRQRIKDQATSTKPAKNDQKERADIGKRSEGARQSAQAPAVSEMDIVMEYLPQFEALEKLALSKLDTLIQTAYNEYTKKRRKAY